jgi:hypothetical protein
MPASPADIDVFEVRKLQQYMRGYNSSLVQSDLRRVGLLLMYNRYNISNIELKNSINTIKYIFEAP